MQSVERLVKPPEVSQEALGWQLAFEQYQEDFILPQQTLSNSRILDVGTGNGDFVHYIQKVSGNKNACGIDFNEHEVPKDCPYLVIGNIQSLPYPNNLFNTTLSRNVLHGIFLSSNEESVTKALSELLRVTEDGGTILYAIKSPEHIQQAIKNHIEDETLKINLLQRFIRNIEAESQYLTHIQSLGNKVSVVFRGPRRIVKIEKRKVQ